MDLRDYKVSSVNKMMDKAENIIISEETMNLIKCRALLSSLYEYVTSSFARVFPDTVNIGDRTLDNFKDAHDNLDHELMNLIRDVVDYVMLDNNYTEL